MSIDYREALRVKNPVALLAHAVYQYCLEDLESKFSFNVSLLSGYYYSPVRKEQVLWIRRMCQYLDADIKINNKSNSHLYL